MTPNGSEYDLVICQSPVLELCRLAELIPKDRTRNIGGFWYYECWLVSYRNFLVSKSWKTPLNLNMLVFSVLQNYDAAHSVWLLSGNDGLLEHAETLMNGRAK